MADVGSSSLFYFKHQNIFAQFYSLKDELQVQALGGYLKGNDQLDPI